MDNKNSNEVLKRIDERIDSQVGYHLLRKSGAEFASDLRNFSKGINSLADSQLLNIIAYGDDIRNQIEDVKFTLSQRVKKI